MNIAPDDPTRPAAVGPEGARRVDAHSPPLVASEGRALEVVGVVGDLSREDQLLVLAARAAMTPELVDEVRMILSHPIDWQSLLIQAERHSVAPLLHNTLSRFPKGFVPAEVRESLSASYYDCAARNMAFMDALGHVLSACRHAGVPVIVLKGAHLAESIYGNIALRPMGDLDVLVQFDDLPTIDGVMESLGYDSPAGILHRSYYHKNHFHIPYLSSCGSVLLEVHWSLQEDLGLLQPDLAEIWRGADRARVAGAESLVMGVEDLLLYLCMHLDKHGYYNRYLISQPGAASHVLRGDGANRLLWFCDISELLRRHGDDMDWPRAASKARRWGIEGAAHCTLELLQRIRGPSLPQGGLASLRPPRLHWYERGLYRFMGDVESASPKLPAVGRWLRRLLLQQNAHLQFRPVRFINLPDYAFPGWEAIARHYATRGPAVAFYSLVHAFRMMARSTLALLRLAYYEARRR